MIEAVRAVGETPEFLLQSDRSLDTADIIRVLSEYDSGFNADVGASGVLHPRISEVQGLRYWQRHITSMDRGRTPQWPVWYVTEQAVDVPLDYALTHDDLPLLSFDPLKERPLPNSNPTASVLRPRMDRIKHVGWAEVFWKLIKGGYVSRQWVEANFEVPMSWIDELRVSPIKYTYLNGSKHSWL